MLEPIFIYCHYDHIRFLTGAHLNRIYVSFAKTYKISVELDPVYSVKYISLPAVTLIVSINSKVSVHSQDFNIMLR